LGKRKALEWERRWRAPAAVAALLSVLLLIVSNVVGRKVSSAHAAEAMRLVEQHKGSVAASSILQAVGFLLMALPLYYLFRAARLRSERMRPQLVGLVLVAPLFLAVASGLSISARTDAADQFVAGEAKSTLTPKEAQEKCATDLKEEGAKEFREEFEPRPGETPTAACERQKTEDDEAENAGQEASLAPITNGAGLAGGLALIVVFVYTNLWAMRTGLLSRFWGSLGMVGGIAFLLGPLFVVTMAWLVYFAFLCFGKVPGGLPPAWEAGEAVPWPTPGEKAAAELEPESSEEPEEATGPEEPEEPEEARRKRKQRSEPGQSE
jgi:hypothetical protein